MNQKTKQKYLIYLKFIIDKAHRDRRKHIMVSVKDLEKIYKELEQLEVTE